MSSDIPYPDNLLTNKHHGSQSKALYKCLKIIPTQNLLSIFALAMHVSIKFVKKNTLTTVALPKSLAYDRKVMD